MKILLTAFNAFGGDETNSSLLTLEKLDLKKEGNITLVKKVLPTEFAGAFENLKKYVLGDNFGAVICLGQAGGRSAITPEQMAVNLMDAKICDNAGFQPQNAPISEGAPDAYFSSLPTLKMVESMQRSGVPASLSKSAGTFVCNRVMWGLLHLLDEENIPAMGGFIHLPYAKEQRKEGYPSLPLALLVKGIACAINCLR